MNFMMKPEKEMWETKSRSKNDMKWILKVEMLEKKSTDSTNAPEDNTNAPEDKTSI